MTAQSNPQPPMHILSHNPIRHSVELEEKNILVVGGNMCSLINDCVNWIVVVGWRNEPAQEGCMFTTVCVAGDLAPNTGHDTGYMRKHIDLCRLFPVRAADISYMWNVTSRLWFPSDFVCPAALEDDAHLNYCRTSKNLLTLTYHQIFLFCVLTVTCFPV